MPMIRYVRSSSAHSFPHRPLIDPPQRQLDTERKLLTNFVLFLGENGHPLSSTLAIQAALGAG
jgi:hypothetical protein